MTKSMSFGRSLPFLLGACGTLLLVGACGGGQHPAAKRAPRGPAVLYVGWGDHAVFELDCFDPAGTCDAVRAKAQGGGELVKGEGRFRLTGPRKEECGASGDVADVVAYETVAGGDEAYPGIAVFPADAAIDLVPIAAPQSDGEAPPPPASTDPKLLALAAKLATADLAKGESPRQVNASELTIAQVVEGNFTGGPAADLLYAAELPLSGEEGPGYVWSGAILVPDGDQGKARSIWYSNLETFRVDATYDLDGDGVRELVISVDYYEGSSVGAVSLATGELKAKAMVGCGA